MFDIFANPGYLAVAAALITAPIIIHLINRMRFKRIRWAAMEFLLKAQKRNRRRLIIEQLLLLALRCFLVALVGLLVMRFVGFSFADFAAKQALHIVLIDDTLSMTDQNKEADRVTDAFQKAKKELMDKVIKKISQVNSKDRLMILPFSKVAIESDFEPKTYEKLYADQNFRELEQDLNLLEPTKLHVRPLVGVKKAQEIINNNAENRITVYVFSDFRGKDWSAPRKDDDNAAPAKDAKTSKKEAAPEAEAGQEGAALIQALRAMVDNQKDMKLFLFDTAHPERAQREALPLAHDNIGLTDFRASTRVAGRAMPVSFSATVTNFSSREIPVHVKLFDDDADKELFDADCLQEMPMRVEPGSSKTATFDVRFNPQIRSNEPFFARISARLRSAQLGELENDGLAADNIRHAAVEIREKVPILVIDGEGAKGRQENKDSFFIRTAIISVPGASYELVYGDELGGGVAAKALERGDLHRFATIYLLNVRELNPKQLANLENYVREGGGAAFFLGPLVSAKQYNATLYKNGQGLFPAPLKETYFPAPNEEPLSHKYTGEPMLLLREDEQNPLGENYPIFGPIQGLREAVKDLPIKRYFQVARGQWQVEAGKVSELATLPNTRPITDFNRAARELVRGSRLEKILAEPEYAKYRKGLDRHARAIETLVRPGSEDRAPLLADALDRMLKDRGQEKQPEEFPNLTEFWESGGKSEIRTLKKEIIDLRDQVRYGDPFIVAKSFGKGRVVAVMTTAGKDWNDWGGGSLASVVYEPFIWELQYYLSSLASEANMTVGTPIQISVDPEQFKQKNRQLKMVRLRPKRTGDKDYPKEEQFGVESQGQLVFNFEKNLEPGLYVSQLHYADGDSKAPLLAVGHVFNVDTAREGPLQRVSLEELKENLIKGRERSVFFLSSGSPSDALVARQSDFSENPLLYLIFLAVLVAEQALAVHLSFHLKASEGDMLMQVTRTKQRVAA
jgi:hypothetical protein